MEYSETTQMVTVSVQPFFLENESDPEKNAFFWAYHIRIENKGLQQIQLINRYWKITDAFGRIQEVRGEGVVGEQPVLAPGESYEYTSGVPLQTPTGFMGGFYEMVFGMDKHVDVVVPTFSLDSPFDRHSVN